MRSLHEVLLEDDQEVGDTGGHLSAVPDEELAEKIKLWSARIVSDAQKYKVDLNKAIAKIAQANNLNNEQIQRIIEKVNTDIYLIEYNRMKNQQERIVEFDLASITKIKDLIGNQTRANVETPADPENKGEVAEMPKRASLNEPLNFLNYSAYDSVGLAEDRRPTLRDIMTRQMTEKIAAMNVDYEQSLSKFSSHVDSMAQALVKYAKLNLDVQHIFENMCKAANLKQSTQIIIKKAVQDHVKTQKEAKQLFPAFELDIAIIDGLTKEASFNLGKHSLAKQATNSNQPLPQIVTDKTLIRDYTQLARLAAEIQQRQEQLQEKAEKKNKVEKMLHVVEK